MFEYMYVTAIVVDVIIALCGVGILALAVHLDDLRNRRAGMRTLLP